MAESSGSIGDDEVVILRIPPVNFKDGKPIGLKVRSRHFKIKDDETGLSCNLESEISMKDLANRPEALAGSGVARARVQDIRSLGLSVESAPLEENPGHTEIRSTETASLSDTVVRDKLAELFKLEYEP